MAASPPHHEGADNRKFSWECGEADGLFFARIGDGEHAADLPDQKVGNFVVPGNGLTTAGRRVPVNRVRSAFPFERAPARFKVPD